MRALKDYRSCVVQESTDRCSVYVLAHPEQIAHIAAVGLTDCEALDESELAAAGISHP